MLQLNKVAKETHFSWFKRQIKQLVDKVGVPVLVGGVAPATSAQWCLWPQVNEVASAISKQRSTVTFAPKDAQQIVSSPSLYLHSLWTHSVFVLCWCRRHGRERTG